MEAKIMVLPGKAPELSRLEFSSLERSEKFVRIDRMRPEFQDKRLDIGGGSLDGAHAIHIRNQKRYLLIITMRECRLHDAPDW